MAITGLTYVAVGLLAAIVYMWRKRQYPVPAIVFEKRANTVSPIFIKSGRRKTKDGKYLYRLKFPKFPFGQVIKTKPFEFESLMVDTKGRNVLILYSPSIDQFVPLNLKEEFNETIEMEVPILDETTGEPILDKKTKEPKTEKIKVPKLKVVALDEDLRQFALNSMEDGLTRYHVRSKFMDRYGGYMMVLVTGVSIAIVLYASADMFQSGTSIMADAVNTAASLKGQVLGQQIATPR